MDERYEISRWFASPTGEARGRALVLPGGGYTVDHPALFWACQVLVQVGWEVTSMRWDAAGIDEADRRSFVERGAELLEAQGGHQQTLVLAKSLGSFAAAWASGRGYPGIWLTPVMIDQVVADALRDYAAPSLLIGGTSDPLWSSPTGRPHDQTVLELADVDHALHRTDWRSSMAALQDSLTAIERFATSL